MDKSMTVQNPKTVPVLYFAHLRKERGLSQEFVNTCSQTLYELYEELQTRYELSFERQVLRVAVNNEFSTWDTWLQPNDIIVFIPPVSGG